VKAKEMFEELGFELVYHSHNGKISMVYTKKYGEKKVSIIFDSNGFYFISHNLYDGFYEKVLKCLKQQCKELGWDK
jgi:hypothetical protein